MSDPRGYLELEQIHRLLEAAKDNDRNYMLLRLLWVTGARVSELLAITPKHIEWEKQLIIMPTEKRRVEMQRLVPVDDKTLIQLRAFLEQHGIRGAALIFDLTRQRVGQIVKLIGRRAGIPNVGRKQIHPHHFRHSHAMYWIKKGGDMRALQIRLGHANFNTTAAYMQYSEDDIRKHHSKVWGDFKW
jgi:integrase/recombinase XerD